MSLPEEELARVDLLFEEVAAKVKPSLFLLLTDRPALTAGQDVFVSFEPFERGTGVVIALSYTEKQSTMSADHWLWTPAFSAGCDLLMTQVDVLLKQERIIEALIRSLTCLPPC